MKCLPISLLSSIWVAEALNCYECVGLLNGPCTNPASKNLSIIDCEEAYEPEEYVEYVCYKATQSVTGKEMIFRGCHPQEAFKSFCTQLTITGYAVCVGCREDLCNPSVRTDSVVFTLVVLILLNMVLTY